MRLRMIEQSRPIYNYFDLSQNSGLKEHIDGIENKKHIINEKDRAWAMQQLYDLSIVKKYKKETLMLAVAMFDRYLHSIELWNFPRS